MTTELKTKEPILPPVPLPECSWKKLHVSAWPGFDRQICPMCNKAYIEKAVNAGKPA